MTDDVTSCDLPYLRKLLISQAFNSYFLNSGKHPRISSIIEG
jgi:hypothetical protein